MYNFFSSNKGQQVLKKKKKSNSQFRQNKVISNVLQNIKGQYVLE